MNSDNTQPKNQPRLRDTLRDDFRKGNHLNTFRREFRDLKEFYIDEEKKRRLQDMSPLKRGLYLGGWLCKSMLMRLTPIRRLVLVLGILLLIAGPTVTVDNSHIRITNLYLLGGAALLLVLMLELKDKLLARDELVAGQRVQRALMPELSPVVPGWSLWIYSRPANDVGGDLIDFIRHSGNRFGIALGDVSGKGLQAALIMAKLQATLKALAPDFESIATLVAKLNTIFHRDGLANSFASLVYAEIMADSGKLRFVNAGHYPPILLTADCAKETEKGEAALGLMELTAYVEHQLELASGEVFLAYSDGLTEACNERGEFFGSERFFRRIALLRDRSPEEIGRALLSEIDFFVGDASPNDDISMIVLKRK